MESRVSESHITSNSSLVVEEDIFGSVLNLEKQFAQQGIEDGIADGYIDGISEGYSLGYHKGYALSSEVGFYMACIQLWKSLLNLDSSSSKTSPGSQEIPENANSETQKEDVVSKGSIPEKLCRPIIALESVLNSFQESGNLKITIMDQLHNIRSKFKLICSQMGVKLRYSGPTIDGIKEDQESAKVPGPSGLTNLDF